MMKLIPKAYLNKLWYSEEQQDNFKQKVNR